MLVPLSDTDYSDLEHFCDERIYRSKNKHELIELMHLAVSTNDKVWFDRLHARYRREFETTRG